MKTKSDWKRLAVLFVAPVIVVYLVDEVPRFVFAACSYYSNPAVLEIEVSTNGEYSWQGSAVAIYGNPGQEIDVTARTLLSVSSGGVDGWSFGLKHVSSGLQSAGGDLVVTAGTADGTDTPTVQNGSPPDLEETQVVGGGYTQGVVIDMDGGYQLGATTDMVTSRACLRIKVPEIEGMYVATLEFTDDLGSPKVQTVVTQNGQNIIPCTDSLTLYVRSTYSYPPTSSTCSILPIGANSGQGAGIECGAPGQKVDTSITILEVGDVTTQPQRAQPGIVSFRLWRGADANGEPSPGSNEWTLPTFIDDPTTTCWEDVSTTPIGYPGFPTDLSVPLPAVPPCPAIPGMQGSYTTFYVRIKFLLADAPNFDADIFSSLEFDIDADDGFVAYLNGQEIRRQNVAGEFGDETLFRYDATAQNEYEGRVSGYNNLHNQDGEQAVEPLLDPPLDHVLAIQVLNLNKNDDDAFLVPRILARKRGPFIARALVDTTQDPATGYEVVIRAAPGLEDSIRVEYFLNGDDTVLFTSDEVSVDNDIDGGFGDLTLFDNTMYRVAIPGSEGGVSNDELPRDTTVTYRVFVGTTRFEEDDLTFRTPRDISEPFTFVAFGQSGLPTQAQVNIAQVIENLCADFYISAGGMAIRNKSYTATDKTWMLVEPSLNVQAADHRFYNVYADTMTHALFYTAAGEEDTESPLVLPFRGDYDAAYAMPETPETSEPGDGETEKYYSFDYGEAHFTVLRSESFNDPAEEGDTGTLLQRGLPGGPFNDQVDDFLVADITGSNKFWKIVVVHHPPYTSSLRDGEPDGLQDDLQFRTELEGFGGFEALGVDLVISAREPLYEQTHAVVADAEGNPTVVQMGPAFLDPGAPVYIVTGGAGEPLWQMECEPGPGCGPGELEGFTMVLERAFHVTKITIDGNVLTIQPIDENGNPIDIDPDPAPGATFSTITKTMRPFIRGDVEQNAQLNLTDALRIFNWLFLGGPPPDCMDSADTDDSGGDRINITDGIFLLNFLFKGGPPPPPPVLGPQGCVASIGPDPTSDALNCMVYECP